MRVLSLGWGVQSFTLAAMSALGEIERVDVALHADTNHERQGTYDFAAQWTLWLQKNGIRVETVFPKDSRVNINEKRGEIQIPAYVDTPSRTGGKLTRQCTNDWKIAPMRRWMQANRNKKPIEQWIGISLDEATRMKPAGVKYITCRWPLIELRMTRQDCIHWLKGNNLEVPSKSACTFCPFHNTAEWRNIKENYTDWLEAVAVDRAIRKARPPYDLFVHPSRIPLEQVDFRTEEEKGQLRLWDEECTGLCGV